VKERDSGDDHNQAGGEDQPPAIKYALSVLASRRAGTLRIEEAENAASSLKSKLPIEKPVYHHIEE
jgi:hypothetical protein